MQAKSPRFKFSQQTTCSSYTEEDHPEQFPSE